MNATSRTATEHANAVPTPDETLLPANDTCAPVTFENGLFGFPECRRFALRPAARDGLFWLQSTEHEPLRFLLVDPFVFVDEYSVDLAESDADELGAGAAADVAILAIVTLPANRESSCSVNLQGPIALNLRSGRARQVIVNDPAYSVRHAIDFERSAAPA